jgi:hypothetical protein
MKKWQNIPQKLRQVVEEATKLPIKCGIRREQGEGPESAGTSIFYPKRMLFATTLNMR